MPTTAAARFTILQSGEIDVLIRDSTLTFTRNIQLGLDEIAVKFYAGEGFLVSKKLGVSKITELNGATICVITGATLELNIADFARSNGTKIGTLLFDKPDEAVAGDGDRALRRLHRRHRQPRRHALHAEDPGRLGRAGRCDQQGAAGHPCAHRRSGLEKILFWTHSGAADGRGTRCDQGERRPDEEPARTRSSAGCWAPKAASARLMGLDDEWALRAIKTGGNYGEMYDEYLRGPQGARTCRAA